MRLDLDKELEVNEELDCEIIDGIMARIEGVDVDLSDATLIHEGLYQKGNSLYTVDKGSGRIKELDYIYGMGDTYNYWVAKDGNKVYVGSDLNIPGDWAVYTLQGQETIEDISNWASMAFALADYDTSCEDYECKEEDCKGHHMPEEVVPNFNSFCESKGVRKDFGL